MDEGGLKTFEVEKGLWMIDDGLCHCYLVVGDTKALLFDTGIGVGNIAETVSKITHKPLSVVICMNT